MPGFKHAVDIPNRNADEAYSWCHKQFGPMYGMSKREQRHWTRCKPFDSDTHIFYFTDDETATLCTLMFC